MEVGESIGRREVHTRSKEARPAARAWGGFSGEGGGEGVDGGVQFVDGHHAGDEPEASRPRRP